MKNRETKKKLKRWREKKNKRLRDLKNRGGTRRKGHKHSVVKAKR